jgi:HD superfamily phosphohydrolase
VFELKVNDKRRETIRMYALLNDADHGPFSHLLEEIMKGINGNEFPHLKITLAIILYDESISNILMSMTSIFVYLDIITLSYLLLLQQLHKTQYQTVF